MSAALWQLVRNRLRGWPTLEIWYHPAYRAPLSSLESAHHVDPRRADYVAWYLVERGLYDKARIKEPAPVSFQQLGLVHSNEYLESLHDPEVLARIFSVDPSDVPVEQLIRTVRLACGGTLEGARSVLRARAPTHALNLLGGFHHAGPSRGGGACALDDVAVALATLRAEGFTGQAWVIDLDAHPPDGLAECLAKDPRAKLSSMSGADWGPLPGVDETRLPEGTGDAAYLSALDQLLSRAPPTIDLAFVLAGGDVLRGDRLGTLGVSMLGARRRDARVARRLRRVPTVWLPAGGYRHNAWHVLAGTALVLLGRERRRISPSTDPLSLRYEGISKELSQSELSGRSPGDATELLSQDDVDEIFGGRAKAHRLMGHYTAQGLEFALERYGFLEQLRRLEYSRFHVAVDATGSGDRMRLFGHDGDGLEQLLVECVVARKTVGGAEALFVNWLTLRHPKAKFGPLRPALPGQDVPGLGLAKEATELLAIMARRLELAGVAFRPSWYHMAYAARHVAHFPDPARQGRFEALVRDLKALPLLEATRALSEGRVLMNGAPYAWEADEMVQWVTFGRARPDEALVRQEREKVAFLVLPADNAPRSAPDNARR